MGCVLNVAGKPVGGEQGRRWLTVWRAAVVYEEHGERVMAGRECASPGRGRGGERERRGGGGEEGVMRREAAWAGRAVDGTGSCVGCLLSRPPCSQDVAITLRHTRARCQTS